VESIIHLFTSHIREIAAIAGLILVLSAVLFFVGGGKYQGLRRDIADKMERAEKNINKSPFQPGTIVILADGKVGVVKLVGNTMKGAGSGVFNFKQEITVEIPGPTGRTTSVFAPEELKIFRVPKD
jgi:hypothetical protein